MKIYLVESKNFMGYSLFGDLGQEYNTKVYPKAKNINVPEKCLEMSLFYIYANKPIYTKESPKIYLYNSDKDIKQIDILTFKDIILKNSFFNKYKRDTSQSLLVQDKNKYTDEDNEQLKYLYTQLEIKEREIFIRNLTLFNKKKDNINE